jgi:uncharacterized protein
MIRWTAALVLLATALPARAETDHGAIAARALNQTILPGFEALAAETAALSAEAEAACAGQGPIEDTAVKAAYDRAFDAWIGVEAFRFGPLAEENAGFALAFWPDTKGSTPRTLLTMLRDEDPVVDDPEAFAHVSVAARGLFALDWLLFDPEAGAIVAGGYSCRLLQAIAGDAARTSGQVLARWRDPWSHILTSAGAADNPVYFTSEEGTKVLYSALTNALQADIDLRLGRPMGTFERPQPRRAEAWRSGRSLENVALSLAALRAYAATAFGPAIGADYAGQVDARFAAALAAVDRVGEPVDVAVATTQGRIRVEALQTAVTHVQSEIAERIGPTIGVTAGFNALDGD